MLTVKHLRALGEGEKLSESLGRGLGTLRFRRTGSVIRIYFRYTKPDGRRDELPLGPYDEDGRDGLTLAGSRERVAALRDRLKSGSGNVRADLEAEAQAQKEHWEAAERQRELERQALEAQQRFTLKRLCEAYVTQLEIRGRTKAARDAGSCFRVHLFQSHPELANTAANTVKSEAIANMLRIVRASGKERTAGVLRSYLSAAFNQAIQARFDTGASIELTGFDLEANPVSIIRAIPVRKGQRTLSENELFIYFQSLSDSVVDEALRLALLAGGQRMSQLLRTRLRDWKPAVKHLHLWDGKGRRNEPREHILPLQPEAAAVVERLITRARSKAKKGDTNPSLWITVGDASLDPGTAVKRVGQIAEDMGGEPFTLRDLRRSAETRMAELGVSKQDRAQLLSHGLSGVQAGHYDKYDYIREKAAALAIWERFLTGRTGNPAT